MACMHTELRPTGALQTDRGVNSCYPSPPLGICLEGAGYPAGARIGDIGPVEAKARGWNFHSPKVAPRLPQSIPYPI